MRTGFKAVVLTVCGALALTSCATKEQTGLGVGAAAGAAAGAAVPGRYKGLAIVAGALIGGLAGALIGRQLDEADQRRAAAAAQAAAAAPDGQRITWSSEKQQNVGGYAEPAGPLYQREPAGATHCYDPNAKRSYDTADGHCAGSDVALNEREYRQIQAALGQAGEPPAPAAPAAAVTPAAVSEAAAPELSCRKVREVVIINGREQKEEHEYCLRAGQWLKA